jgi:SWI/SNF-related matrix-associated actin-dependent regulator of chromatin subfamily A-like protein 1
VILDWVEKTGAFTLSVQRWEHDPETIKEEHGFDLSLAASTPSTAVLFTREPYAAVTFFEHATPAAAAKLQTLQDEIALSWATTSQGHIDCPDDQELSPFQIAGVEYAKRRQNTLIGDQPGLGKTMQAICFCNEIKARKVLVVCPANIRLQWWKKIQQWTTMQGRYTVHAILNGRHGVNPHAQWVIVSYDLARTAPIWKALADGLWDCIILDEGHYLKTIDALRTRTVFGGGEAPLAASLASRSGSILDLTGTPLPNRPREAYTAARGLCWDAIDYASEDKFASRFNPSLTRFTDEGKAWIDERTGRHGELQSRLRANFMVRRLKRDVLPQLKLPVLDIVHVDETAAVKQALRAEQLLDIDPENLEGIDAEIMGEIATVRRLMGVAIAPLAADYVDMLLEGGEEKVVVFYYHKQVREILEKALAKYRPLVIDGSVPPGRRQVMVDQFKMPGYRLMLGQILAIGTGTDGLQEACQRGVAAEADWTPGVNEQAVNRLDRMGQKHTVHFDFLVARGSFSERILGTSLRKLATTHKALDRRF